MEHESALAQPVLSLNSAWLPVGVVSTRCAIEDMLSLSEYGDAPKLALDITMEDDVLLSAVPKLWEDWIQLPVRAGDDYIPTAHSRIRAPTVLICQHFAKIPFHIPNLNATAIFERDAFTCQYCLTPNHRALTSDLRWVPIGNLKTGDQLVGFEERLERPGGRRYLESCVEAHLFEKAHVFCVTLDNGIQFMATAEHQWLARAKKVSAAQWYCTDQILGKFIPELFQPWNDENTRSAGWLAGVLDGEGWLASRRISVALAQNPGLVLDHIQLEFRNRGFDFSLGVVSGRCIRVHIKGSGADKARLLGSIRPMRLLHDFKVSMLGRMQADTFRKIVAVEGIGTKEIVKMKTSTGTFIADGFPHHNCGRVFPRKQLNLDHVFPESRGGKKTWTNLVSCCIKCNTSKGDRTPREAGMHLIRRPTAPKMRPMTFHFSVAKHPHWRPFLHL